MVAGALSSPRTARIAKPAVLRGSGFAPPAVLIDAVRTGRPVILCDDEDRENEGDLIFAARFATPALVNLMIRQCGGLICVALAPELVARFGLAPMVQNNRDPKGTAFTASVDAASGIGTGISARDRARTIGLLGDYATRADGLVSPGHVFPLAARAGGLAERRGHTEAGVLLAEAAGLVPAAAICEILDRDGDAMRRDALLGFAAAAAIPIGTVAALVDCPAVETRILTC
ncbi:MAG: 3,4-dihydroxy-2-butanone-4-phosphate synthase [Alphaproteobacteria bacterium]|nr:3,4-dihydroxy-2-butanone-4-phosphate synthase [Alphaproteobacteria bacterium]